MYELYSINGKTPASGVTAPWTGCHVPPSSSSPLSPTFGILRRRGRREAGRDGGIRQHPFFFASPRSALAKNASPKS